MFSLEWEYLTLIEEWLNNYLNGLNAPTIFSLEREKRKFFFSSFDNRKDKPCDNVGDEDEDDDEIEDDLLCWSLSLNDWLIFSFESFSAISASDQIPHGFFRSVISFSSNFLFRSLFK